MYKLFYALSATCLINLSLVHAAPSKTLAQHAQPSRFFLKGGLGYTFGFKGFKEDPDYEDKEVITYTKGKVNSHNPSYIIGLGYKFNQLYSTDITFNRINAKYIGNKDDYGMMRLQTMKTNVWFLNFCRNFLLTERYTPYISAGLGYAETSGDLKLPHIDGGFEAKSARHKKLAWNTALGLRTKIFSQLELDIACRYLYLGKIYTKPTTNVVDQEVVGMRQKLKAYNITLGFIYNI